MLLIEFCTKRKISKYILVGADLLSSSRLPPVPEEPAIAAEDNLYRSGMSVDTYNPQTYIADSQISTPVTMPTSQMTIHGIFAYLIILNVEMKYHKYKPHSSSRYQQQYTNADDTRADKERANEDVRQRAYVCVVGDGQQHAGGAGHDVLVRAARLRAARARRAAPALRRAGQDGHAAGGLLPQVQCW